MQQFSMSEMSPGKCASECYPTRDGTDKADSARILEDLKLDARSLEIPTPQGSFVLAMLIILPCLETMVLRDSEGVVLSQKEDPEA